MYVDLRRHLQSPCCALDWAFQVSQTEDDMSRRVETLPVNSKGKLLDEYGREIVSRIPMAPPVGFQEQPSMADLIDQKIRAHLEMQREAALELAGDEDEPWLDDDENEGFTKYEFAAAAYDTVTLNPHRAENPRPPAAAEENSSAPEPSGEEPPPPARPRARVSRQAEREAAERGDRQLERESDDD